VSNFQFLFGSLTPDGLEATYSADLSQTAYTMETGGMSLGANLLTTDDFEVFIGGGFNPLTNYLGTFPETFVSATFTGDVAGNAVIDELDPSPSRTSLGSVTISAAPGGEFFIDNRAAIYGVYTINGGDPITVPVALTVGAPEPSTWAMVLLGFAGLGFVGHRARRKTVAVA
jgi:PEP-CTERM motif